MTAEKFHDALTLLPADLVAEADAVRSRRPSRLRLSWASMAACFALLLGLGSFALSVLSPVSSGSGPRENALEAPAAAAPAMDFAVQSAEEAVTAEIPAAAPAEPLVPAATEAYLPYDPGILSIRHAEVPAQVEHPAVHLITDEQTLRAFLDPGSSLEGWFETRDMLLIYLPGTYHAASIRQSGDTWTVTLAPSGSESGNCLLVETEKGLIPGPEAVELVFE